MRNANVEGPDPIDIQVGLRIRAVRRQIAVSQDALAAALGISFQQLQKYERGANRVSASVLVKTARALGCSAEKLLPSFHEPEVEATFLDIVETAGQAQGVNDLVKAFVQIESEEEREQLLALAKLLARRTPSHHH